MGRRGFVGTAGVVAALLLGAAGCGGDPEPQFAPPSEAAPPSETASPSASASESAAPTLSPEETVEAWVSARNDALDSGDIAAVKRLATPGCKPCSDYVDPIAEIVANGGQIESPGWTVGGLQVTENSSPDRPVVSGRLVRTAGTTIPAAGGEPFSYERQVDEAFFELAEGESGWQIDFIYFSQR